MRGNICFLKKRTNCSVAWVQERQPATSCASTGFRRCRLRAAEPDCPPVRLRLLGEDLVAFRNTNGDVGIFVQACPHRGASLFFGRNEEAGLRCVYHGWKFDIEGNCVDMPSEPAESNFKAKVKVRAYPARDVNHMVWIYMGPRETPPPFPEFEILSLPPEQVNVPNIMMEEANWFQNLEGDIDSVHIDYLHGRCTSTSR